MTAQQYSPDNLTTEAEESTASAGKIGLNLAEPLNRQLLKTLLPLALLPLAISSGLGIWITRRAEREDALFLLKEESFLASEAASVFVEDNFKIIEAVLLNPVLFDALREADQDVESKNLDQQTDDALERQFGQTKLVSTDTTLNKYLADVAEVEGMGEIFVTERHGLNVAYSAPTSDFVQRDEDWWQQAQQNKKHIEPVSFDDSSGVLGISISEAVSPLGSDEFLGVMKAVVPITVMEQRIATYVTTAITGTQKVQVVDNRNGTAFSTISAEDIQTGAPQSGTSQTEGTPAETLAVVGGEPVAAIAQALSEQLGRTGDAPEALLKELAKQTDAKLIELDRIETATGDELLSLLLESEGREYSVTTIPKTAWVSIASAELAEINSAGRDLLITFILTALIVGAIVALLLQQVAKRLSAPLQQLTATAEQASEGDLTTRATLQGSQETQILGQGFNTLLEQLQTSLSDQEAQTEEQRQLREGIENDIAQLMEDVGDAVDGDLSVRAQLSAGDVGIVADLINAIVENLRGIALNVRESTGNVSQSLTDNEQQILSLADEAVAEAQSMQSTMGAVEDMATSIRTVAENASQASRLTNDTYTTVQAEAESMDKTAQSILELRSTVGDTAKKIKRLGESAQKISQAVSLIDSISLKTNLLAVNASVEAARAGELGQGFTAIAQQVSALAEQSAGATKTIAQIVAEIQTETQEVVDAIETGTGQVVESSNLVKTTQQQLQEVLAQSDRVNQLMKSISAATVDQTKTSTAVTALIKQAAENSQQRSETSAQLAQAIQDTAQVTQTLQASVEQFKVTEK